MKPDVVTLNQSEDTIARLLAPDFDLASPFARSVFRAQANKIVLRLVDIPEHLPTKVIQDIEAVMKQLYGRP